MVFDPFVILQSLVTGNKYVIRVIHPCQEEIRLANDCCSFLVKGKKKIGHTKVLWSEMKDQHNEKPFLGVTVIVSCF